MKHLILSAIVLLVAAVALSCAGADPVVPMSSASSQFPAASHVPTTSGQSRNRVLWGVWDGYISADRSEVTFSPLRSAAFQLNVVGFLEQNPCTSCLQLVSKKIVGPNRLDVTVQLRHPWPGYNEYTGFDVLGGIQFPATRSLQIPWPGGGATLSISWRFDGAPQMLNPDGFSCNFNIPNYWPDQPDWKWFIEGKLGGKSVWDPFNDSILIWPYRLYYTDSLRNMFHTTGAASRTYELWLPEGKEIRFGYVVIAHWEPPVVTPVTDPVTDFDRRANKHGPYRCELLDISGPVSPTQDAYVHFKLYQHPCYECNPYTNPGLEFGHLDLFGNGGAHWKNTELVSEDNGVYEYILTLMRWPDDEYKGPPGIYPYAISVGMEGCDDCYGEGLLFVFEIEVQD